MITLTYNQLKSAQFGVAFSKLVTSKEVKTMQTIYKIAKIGKKLSEEERIMMELQQNLVKKFAVLDEAGNIVMDAEGNYNPKPELVEEHKKAMADFWAVTVSVDLPKLDLKELRGIGITAQDLIHLSCLLDEPV